METLFKWVPLFLKSLPFWTTMIVLYISLVIIKHWLTAKNEDQNKKDETQKPIKQQEQQQPHQKPKKKHQQFEGKWAQNKQKFSHDWLLNSLKGHGGSILDMDFSPNGKYLATCGDDRAIFIWNTVNWKDKEQKYIRYNVEFDHASLVCWRPDSKAIIYTRFNDNWLEVCKVNKKKKDGTISSIEKGNSFNKAHKENIIGIGVDVNGRYLMTCSSDTEIIVWGIDGSILSRIDTYFMKNNTAKISPCGNFIAASGFAPDVKIWQVCFKNGEFVQVASVFQLKGHTTGVCDFSFNADSSLMATVTKDGSWKLFNIKIEYIHDEEPKLLKTGKIETEENARDSHIALSPNGHVIVISLQSNLIFINALTGETDKTIKDIYEGSSIRKIAFDSGGEYVITCGKKHARIFQNVTGWKAAAQDAREKLKTSNISSATKERLTAIIESSENKLKNLKEKKV